MLSRESGHYEKGAHRLVERDGTGCVVLWNFFPADFSGPLRYYPYPFITVFTFTGAGGICTGLRGTCMGERGGRGIRQPYAPPLHLLVERTALCWLETYYLDALAAQLREEFSTPFQMDAIERRRDHAQHRFLTAARTLANVRKLLFRSPAPIEIATRSAAKKQTRPPKAAPAVSRGLQAESQPGLAVGTGSWN
jgi:hypothetical protein